LITLYSKPNCPHCVQAKAYLDRHAIDYRTVNVLEDAEALAFIKGRGHKTVPQIYVGENLLVEGGNSSLQALSPVDVRERVAALDESI
jgi:glutaredoxin-like protein NrdH